MSVRLQTKWLNVWIPLQALNKIQSTPSQKDLGFALDSKHIFKQQIHEKINGCNKILEIWIFKPFPDYPAIIHDEPLNKSFNRQLEAVL